MIFCRKTRELSEELVRRDTFFHTCWLRFKNRHPEFRGDMDDIELEVAGITQPIVSAKTQDEEKPEDDATIL